VCAVFVAGVRWNPCQRAVPLVRPGSVKPPGVGHFSTH
jgi:hypothetical protein